MTFDLSGKTALVTGASGGIGSAIARQLHRQGARVLLSGRRHAALSEGGSRRAQPSHRTTSGNSRPFA